MARPKSENNMEDESLKRVEVDSNVEVNMEDKGESRYTEEVKVTPAAKKVKVRAVEDIHCIVACISYTFIKDKEYLVPSDVAAILCNANKAYRL